MAHGCFKGGYITRHYGNPKNNIDAVQLKISQITYMDEAPNVNFRKDKADKLRPVLKHLSKLLLVNKCSISECLLPTQSRHSFRSREVDS